VLYHHGGPPRRRPITNAGPDGLEALALPEAARQQITVARAMVAALDAQREPLDRPPRADARRQARLSGADRRGPRNR
jgi:hypothetical protein